VRRDPGASPSSLLVDAIIKARIRNMLGRRSGGQAANFGSTDQWISSTLAAISRRRQGVASRLGAATTGLARRLAASHRRSLGLGLDRHREAGGEGAGNGGRRRRASPRPRREGGGRGLGTGSCGGLRRLRVLDTEIDTVPLIRGWLWTRQAGEPQGPGGGGG
jgi:hypothetical protein